jgi:broad specificity phosphatase PhoE
MPDDVLVRLVALRHGETTLNAAGLLTGQLDPPLTARGREQARAAAPLVAGAFDVVVHSGTARTAETLRLARPGGAAAEVDARWRERSFGALEGRPRATWPTAPGLDAAPPGGESYRALSVRVQAALDDLRARGRADGRPLDVLLCTHSGVLRALSALTAGDDAFTRPGAANGAVVRLEL